MPLFGRSKQVASHDGVTRFWAWWTSSRGRIESAIEDQTVPTLADEITRMVQGINPGLVWELGPNPKARYTFCISSEGNLAIRHFAEDWLAAAPTTDQLWAFVTARPPVPASSLSDIKIDIGGTSARVGEARVRIAPDRGRERLNILMWHPAFASLPREGRARLGFLILDTALGEDGVERWLGQIDWAESPVDRSLPIADLPDEVSRFATEATGDQFALYQGPSLRTGKPLILNLNTALKHIDHIGKEHLLTVSIPSLSAGANGMPAAEETARLEPVEDQLDVDLKEVAVMGRLTGDASRVLYRYVTSEKASEVARSWATRYLADRRVTVNLREDANWDWYREGIYRVFKPKS